MRIIIHGLTPEQLEDIFSWARIGANNCMIGEGIIATELPDHGDLIDRDALINRLSERALELVTRYGGQDDYADCISEICEDLEYFPVVIPAERSVE